MPPMKLIIIALVILVSFNSLGSPMDNGKLETQKLFDSVFSLAKTFLIENEEFLPFSEIMKTNGERVSLSAQLDEERPSSSDLIALLKSHYIELVKKNEIIASALACDIRTETSDAIAIDLDHVKGYSVTIVIPYKLTEIELVLDEMYAVKGKVEIFVEQ